MKQYIKDGKIFNLPVEVKIGNKVTYTNNEKFLKENGYEEYIPTPYKPTLEEEIEASINFINKQTDEKILNDFTYNGYEFYLTIENQTNFSNMFIARDFLNYPQKVKTKDGFMELEDASEVTNFYLAGVNFIKECIESGWEQKANLEKEIRENYK